MIKDDAVDAAERARMPADVDAPDKVAYGLTWRQLAILAVAGALFYLVWTGLHTVVAPQVIAFGGVLVGGVVFGLVVGRRDGLPMDVWLLHAIRHSRGPKALASSREATAGVPEWVQQPKGRTPVPAPLRLPADAIGDDGEISVGGGRAAIVAATTVNLALRTPGEQQALVDTFGRWLNSLSTPTQVVVSAQPVDLASHATGLEARAHRLPHPALEAACADHARFLDDLAYRRDPLRRQVLIVTRALAGGAGGHAARRRADDTVRSLSGLGVTTRALDGDAATAAIAACADPYRPPRTGGLAAPDAVITGAPLLRARRKKASP
ncbi:PrgI family protein [Micromonospora sp. NBC_01813]|uniref:PrgI family protein n=1 Tax=Micromonospora sp. NBC_01813 TaxID=2975988 RepID=UPI002DD9A096|nr:PrgI family protein [Micromonospora sp. NBC_01813]WSA06993.1 PrgI family protein [Micromonospora sp. NBC_01813]